jgi:hypothetical protein
MPPLSPISYNFLTGRAFPQLGMTWSYPLVHRSEDITATIEPMTGVSPAGGRQPAPHPKRGQPARVPGPQTCSAPDRPRRV